jgi:transcriptional regulator with XRE-family HTH domain
MRMVHDEAVSMQSSAGPGMPTPEAMVGQELRRLRMERGWSQEEVARRMAAYGYDSWRQSTVGRTETAQRPLRLNEAVHLAALFGVPIMQLLTPLPLRLDLLDEEIRLTEEGLASARRAADELRPALYKAQQHSATLAHEYDKHAKAIQAAEAHLEIQRGLRDLMAGRDVSDDVAARLTEAHEAWEARK